MKRSIQTLFITIGMHLPSVAQEPANSPGPAVNESIFGARISRTMTALATSTATGKNSAKVLFYGQSITAQAWADIIAERLRKKFPHADLTIENRAIGGFEADRLVKTANSDLYPFYPDLVIFHVYGGGKGELERILMDIRRKTTAEILISTHHLSHPGNAWVQAEYDKQSQAIRDLAEKYDCELVDVREEWKEYLSANDLKPQDLLRDAVHLNDKGCALMADLVWRHLCFDKSFANPHAEWIKTVPVQPRSDGSFKVEFEGNRVDILADPADESRSTARILIDGQPPSANSGAFTATRATKAQDVWWPALYTVGTRSAPLVEDWTLKLTEINPDTRQFKFVVAGSKTGPDGSGDSSSKFISNSGRVVIDPQDFGIEAAQAYTKKPCPEGFEIKWAVVPMFKDTYQTPKSADPAMKKGVTIVQLIENGPHTLEILPNGSSSLPIREIQVFRPPLR